MKKLSEIPTTILVHTHVIGEIDLCHLKTSEAFEFPKSYSGYLKKSRKSKILDKGNHVECTIDLF